MKPLTFISSWIILCLIIALIAGCAPQPTPIPSPIPTYSPSPVATMTPVPTPVPSLTPTSIPPVLIQGVDASFLQQIEDAGGKYFDQGSQMDALVAQRFVILFDSRERRNKKW